MRRQKTRVLAVDHYPLFLSERGGEALVIHAGDEPPVARLEGKGCGVGYLLTHPH